MKSHRNRRFIELQSKLPVEIKRQAKAAYKLFKRDPYHPSLQFKRVDPNRRLYSVRIGKNYRAIGIRESQDVIIWVWIGTHAEYDKMLAQ